MFEFFFIPVIIAIVDVSGKPEAQKQKVKVARIIQGEAGGLKVNNSTNMLKVYFLL